MAILNLTETLLGGSQYREPDLTIQPMLQRWRPIGWWVLSAMLVSTSRSLMLVTALVPHMGYDRAAQVAKLAHRERLTLTEAALALGYATPSELAQWLDPIAMVGQKNQS